MPSQALEMLKMAVLIAEIADFMLDMVDFHQEHMDKVISTKKIYGLLVYPLVNIYSWTLKISIFFMETSLPRSNC